MKTKDVFVENEKHEPGFLSRILRLECNTRKPYYSY